MHCSDCKCQHRERTSRRDRRNRPRKERPANEADSCRDEPDECQGGSTPSERGLNDAKAQNELHEREETFGDQGGYHGTDRSIHRDQHEIEAHV